MKLIFAVPNKKKKRQKLTYKLEMNLNKLATPKNVCICPKCVA